jgi:5-keto-L-gluconate epimerase
MKANHGEFDWNLSLILATPEVNSAGRLACLTGSFEEKLDKARRLQCDGVELMVRHPALLDWPGIKAALSQYRLEVPQLVTGELFGEDQLCLVTSDENCFRRALERLFQVIDLAAYLGTAVNIGRVRGRLDLLRDCERPMAVAVQRIRLAADYAASLGVRLHLEPVNRYETDFIRSTQEGLDFLALLQRGNVGLMLDVFHMNIEDASIEASFREAGPQVWHIHLADSNRLYPGAGHLDFRQILHTLREIGYTGFLSVEVIPSPDPDTAAACAIEFLRHHKTQ